MSLPRGRFYIAISTPCVSALVAAVFVSLVSTSLIIAAEVIATKLDGSTVGGDLRSWDDHEIVIAAPAGEQKIAADQLLSLRWPKPAEVVTSDAKETGVVELTDGTILPIFSLRVTGPKATLALRHSRAAANDSIELPTSELAAARFRKFDGELAKQWDEIRQLNSAGDLLVVLKKDGKSLDYVEGVVGDVGDEKIDFKLDGESNRLDRAKVAAVVYHRGDRPKLVDSHLVLQSSTGLRATAAKIELKGAHLHVTTIGGAQLQLAVDDIDFADFSAGKITFLSDIEPASQKYTSFVGLPAGATLAGEYGQPRRDHSAFGGPLSLLIKNKDDDASAQATPRAFTKGLSIRSRTELVYRLPTGFNRFTAIAGIDPATRAAGNVRLSVFADDHALLETEITGSDAPQPIDVQIDGAKLLRIFVDYGHNQDTGDWLNLCDAKIVK